MERLWRAIDEATTEPPRNGGPGPWLYGGALLAAAIGASLAFPSIIRDRLVFLLLAPAPVLAAGLGGLRPGLSLCVGATAAGLLLVGRSGLGPASLADGALFAALEAIVAVGGERLRRSQALATMTTRRLYEREAHLQSILDTVPDAMIVVDEAGLVQSFSAAAERLFDWPAAEMLGRNVKALMPLPDRAAHDAHLGRYLQTSERHVIGIGRVVLCERKGGDTFPAELSVGEVWSGGHRYFTGFLRDLSERQEAERRFDLVQSELLHISRLSAMGEMAAALAHELNQPLSAITNYLRGGQRLLEAENPHSRAITPMDKAAEQSLRAGDIIRHLREFVARGENERRVESLPKLLEEASALALVGARSLGITVRMERDPAIDQVFVDKIQVQQVVVNLVRNALEAMETTTRRELWIKIAPGPDDMAEICVADSGPGVSPQIAARLFQPFVSTKNGQGMGVGLSICRSIIEAHGGRIWVESSALGGAAFRFTVPRAMAEASA